MDEFVAWAPRASPQRHRPAPPKPMFSTAWPRRRTPSAAPCSLRPEFARHRHRFSRDDAPDHRPTRDRRDQPAQTTRTGGPDDSRQPAGLKHLDKFRVDPRVGLFSSFTMAVTIAIVGGRPAMISTATGAIALVVAPLARQYGLDYLVAAVLLAGCSRSCSAFWGSHG